MSGLTDYHALYMAHELTRRHASDSTEKLAGIVAGAQVDLNPHQVEAALFAFRSPLSKGALLADEVGLGKTIEAGLVLSQRWAERKRRMLVIVPANLRKQWQQELSEKFFLPCVILESKSYNDSIKHGRFQPFAPTDAIVICSYQFAKSKASDVSQIPWDLVVLDEAHRLRNVYKPSNQIANTLKGALAHAPKLLLTATPLQNSLLELYGLVSFVDEHAFGDLPSFREQYARLEQAQVFEQLRRRLRPLCHRTLRRQVTAYVSYTKRLPLVEEFTPEESEDQLYAAVSEYLQRDNLAALPPGQRTLMTLVLRKLLASSTFAIAGALESIAARLKSRLGNPKAADDLTEPREDYEAFDATAEEWPEDEPPPPLSDHERNAIEREIAELERFSKLAASIQHNAKGSALLKALDVAFARAKQLGAEAKAIIFTESRRTQDYLLRVLAGSAHAQGLVLFNGSNTDEGSRKIYAAWLAKHAGTDRVSGSRTADMRSALVDYFREEGRIMIATEAGAEGINLQFCSLVVNYDLPWNPQRIEQRIGRCHRYGQKHDVVVVNFLNRKNEADQRVYQLLAEKFQLFEGVFGASDEVLGAIESGVDFEKRISMIYQRCRRPDEIRKAFDQLQQELHLEIDEAMSQTRHKLLEHFDEEVREKLRVCDRDSRAYLDRFEQMLMKLTRYELRDHAEFVTDSAFHLKDSPFPGDIPAGLYELPRRSGEAHLYRLGHPLAEAVLERARHRRLPSARIEFEYSNHPGKVTVLEPLVGRTGWLRLSALAVESEVEVEDHLLVTATFDSGPALEAETAARLLSLPGSIGAGVAGEAPAVLGDLAAGLAQKIQRDASVRQAAFLEAEANKLDGWADDLKAGLEREIKDVDKAIKEARRLALAAQTLEDKVKAQRHVKSLEAQRTEKRRTLFDAQDDIDRRREALLDDVSAKLTQKSDVRTLFTIQWSVK